MGYTVDLGLVKGKDANKSIMFEYYQVDGYRSPNIDVDISSLSYPLLVTVYNQGAIISGGNPIEVQSESYYVVNRDGKLSTSGVSITFSSGRVACVSRGSNCSVYVKIEEIDVYQEQ